MLLLFLGLRYTGLLSGISFVTNSAMLQSGLMDAEPDETEGMRPFDYNFQIEDLQGNPVSMEQFKGKVVFLNFWATWCPPCRAEMPSIQALYDSVDHQQIAFVMLSIDKKEHRQKIVNYINEKGFTFPVYHLAVDQLPEHLQIASIPTTFVISKNGNVEMRKAKTANYATEKFQRFLEELALE